MVICLSDRPCKPSISRIQQSWSAVFLSCQVHLPRRQRPCPRQYSHAEKSATLSLAGRKVGGNVRVSLRVRRGAQVSVEPSAKRCSPSDLWLNKPGRGLYRD